MGAPITTVTGVGVAGKDVQPKSPGANDEDDDEGITYYWKTLMFGKYGRLCDR